MYGVGAVVGGGSIATSLPGGIATGGWSGSGVVRHVVTAGLVVVVVASGAVLEVVGGVVLVVVGVHLLSV